jgi:hypothetical protein
MADERKSAKHTAKRVLADSANAKHRFGFAGEHGSPIRTAPKLSDLWFIEFKPVTGERTYNTSHISALAKSVSPISINTSTMPIDQYGKRVHVPTRVDFPEVGLTMYDTVDGHMFDIAASIYSKFFKNQDAKVTGANAEEVLTSAHLHGRKLPDDKHAYYHQHFEKITIYHFFGNLVPQQTHPMEKGTPLFGARATTGQGDIRTGSVQKIELINPLVTSISFSPSDYAVGDLRTMDFSIQPENIIIGNVDDSVAFPDWMTWGMDYMLDELSPQMKRKDLTKIYPEPVYKFENSIFRQGAKGREDGTEEYEDAQGKKRVNQFGEDDREQAQSLTDPLRIEEQEYNDTNRKLNELMRLYNAQIQNPNEQGNEALEMALKDRIGVIDLARSKRFSSESSKTYIDEGNQFDTPYTATYTNPDIPTFGGIGDSNPGGQGYPRYSTDIGSAMIRELVGSFFGNRKFNVNNIKGTIVNKIIGNDGKSESKKILGSILTDGMVSSKKGAYVTTTKANQSIPTKESAVYKTNTTDQAIGVSKALLRKFLNN